MVFNNMERICIFCTPCLLNKNLYIFLLLALKKSYFFYGRRNKTMCVCIVKNDLNKLLSAQYSIWLILAVPAYLT